MSARNDPKTIRPKYDGPRDSVSGEVLPPACWERDSGGIPAQDFDSEKFLADNGYAHEASTKRAAAQKAAEKVKA